MIFDRSSSTRVIVRCLFALVALSFTLQFLSGAMAQQALPDSAAHPHPTITANSEQATIPALFISDIHFDPFHDPAKVKRLIAAPVSEWRAILGTPSTVDQSAAFSEMQATCEARGVDTPYVLFRSSLQAMRARQPNAKFMLVSGDLIAHAFTCRYESLFPHAAAGDYQAFVVKTISFVIDELRGAFPGMPVYVAMGNNDSGCGDYKLDAGGDFLARTGQIVAAALPASQRQENAKQFAAGGYYSVTMAAPMLDTRLIVVNDLVLSPKYSTCGDKPDRAADSDQMAWLGRQLQQAREAGQKVWVMGHIPPGIDPFSTVARFRNVCGGQAPVEFLSSNKLSDLMVEYADVVRLGIFGHTHMDEMRLLTSTQTGSQSTDSHSVAVKVVSSISPVDGNNPSFTIARINPNSALLENYDVVAASNQSGIATTWNEEYDFAKTYHETEFSSSTLKKLLEGFAADQTASTAASAAYIRDYFVGDMSSVLTPFWPEYVCALDNQTAKGFAACVCSTPQ